MMQYQFVLTYYEMGRTDLCVVRMGTLGASGRWLGLHLISPSLPLSRLNDLCLRVCLQVNLCCNLTIIPGHIYYAFGVTLQ